MKVIFLQNVKKMGLKNEVKDVNEGHARNFLIPNKLVVEATPKALNDLKKQEDQKKSIQTKNDKAFEEAIGKLDSFVLKLRKKANAEGHLFSSLGLKEIVSKLHENGIYLHEEDFELKNPIKRIGKMEIKIKKNPNKNLEIIIEKE